MAEPPNIHHHRSPFFNQQETTWDWSWQTWNQSASTSNHSLKVVCKKETTTTTKNISGLHGSSSRYIIEHWGEWGSRVQSIPFVVSVGTELINIVYSSVCSSEFNPQRSLQNKSMAFFVFISSSKGSSASECRYVDVKTYKLLWRSIFLAQQPEKIHTYTQHTNMQAIIPVSNQSRATICRSSCTSFLYFVFLFFLEELLVALFWLCFARVNHWFFFLTWQCLVASVWPGTVWIGLLWVCTCVSTRGKVWAACQVAGFHVVEAEKVTPLLPLPVSNRQ